MSNEAPYQNFRNGITTQHRLSLARNAPPPPGAPINEPMQRPSGPLPSRVWDNDASQHSNALVPPHTQLNAGMQSATLDPSSVDGNDRWMGTRGNTLHTSNIPREKNPKGQDLQEYNTQGLRKTAARNSSASEAGEKARSQRKRKDEEDHEGPGPSKKRAPPATGLDSHEHRTYPVAPYQQGPEDFANYSTYGPMSGAGVYGLFHQEPFGGFGNMGGPSTVSQGGSYGPHQGLTPYQHQAAYQARGGYPQDFDHFQSTIPAVETLSRQGAAPTNPPQQQTNAKPDVQTGVRLHAPLPDSSAHDGPRARAADLSLDDFVALLHHSGDADMDECRMELQDLQNNEPGGVPREMTTPNHNAINNKHDVPMLFVDIELDPSFFVPAAEGNQGPVSTATPSNSQHASWMASDESSSGSCVPQEYPTVGSGHGGAPVSYSSNGWQMPSQDADGGADNEEESGSKGYPGVHF